MPAQIVRPSRWKLLPALAAHLGGPRIEHDLPAPSRLVGGKREWQRGVIRVEEHEKRLADERLASLIHLVVSRAVEAQAEAAE